MPNPRGLDPFPRSYDESVPASHVPYLEDIRRTANAVRVLRRRGRPAGSAEFRASAAAKRYRDFLDQEQHEHENPTLW